ncbi:hypothetical protein [Shewanella xiamenensis]|uniref:hypothetical protein n=1 Tax=Shewanella xiamenensis TaxID=332186 RepID=UPI000849CF62|nr:hypothetical protein [Shewanella xiamenensis]ODR87368.1 hypothetical protein ABT47_19975 [Shewanella xiamenensis]
MTTNQFCQLTSVVILLVQDYLAAWTLSANQVPVELPIEGEKQWLACTKGELLSQALADIDSRLGGRYPLQLIYDAKSQSTLEAALPKLLVQLSKRGWQILSYEHLAKRCALTVNAELPKRSLVAEQLLPMLLAADNATERQKLQAAATHREHEALTQQLQLDREQIMKENERLSAQNAILRRVDAEQLMSYLPALFPRVFTVIDGTELALLAGRIEPFKIANPYPEPSQETLHHLQRQFKTLPIEIQRQIIGFVSRLPQRQQLTPRPEMRGLIEQLEADRHA